MKRYTVVLCIYVYIFVLYHVYKYNIIQMNNLFRSYKNNILSQ